MQRKQVEMDWCRFQCVLGPRLGFPMEFFLVDQMLVCLKAGTSNLPGDLLALQSINRQLVYPFPSSLSCMFLKLLLNSE